jgi:hypothetical protein
MITVKRFLGTGIIAGAATLAFAGVASAKAGERTFPETYPRASQLCANIAAGAGPKRLRPYAKLIATDCTTLQNEFTAAQSVVLAARTSLESGVTADKAAIAAVCTPPVANRAVCRSTRKSERLAIRGLRVEHVAAVHLYYRTIEANRRTFWAEIHALPGSASLPSDTPIPPQSS